VIRTAFYFCAGLWMLWFFTRVLFIAGTRGYIFARTDTEDRTEFTVSRQDDPKKFWINVIAALLMLPVAGAALYFSSVDLYAALTARTHVQ
jgi:hypothetical protein